MPFAQTKYSLMVKDVLPDILSHTYRLLALNRDQAEDAILNPAYQKGDSFASPRFDFTDEALDAILDFLTKGNEQQVESFQLQIICQFVENIVIKENKTLIERTDLGEISEIFENYYESLIGRIPAKEDQVKARAFIEEGLILEADEIRLSLHEGQIERDFGISPELLEQLEETRLIRGEPSPRGGQIYELSHDTLIKPILRAKQRRLEDEAREKYDAERAEREEARRALNERQQKRIIFYALGAVLLVFLGNFAFSWIRGINQHEHLMDRLSAQKDSLEHVVDSLVQGEATPEEILAQLQKPLPEEKLESDQRISQLVDQLYEYEDQPNSRGFRSAKDELLTYKNDAVMVRDVIYAAETENRYKINKASTWLIISAIEQVDPKILRQESNLILEYLQKVEPNVGVNTRSDITRIRSLIKSDRRAVSRPADTDTPTTKTEKEAGKETLTPTESLKRRAAEALNRKAAEALKNRTSDDSSAQDGLLDNPELGIEKPAGTSSENDDNTEAANTNAKKDSTNIPPVQRPSHEK